MKNMGNLCAQVTSTRAFVQDCGENGETYSLVAVPEFDPRAAASAVNAAALLNSAADRQRNLLAKLQEALKTCKFSAALAYNASHAKKSASLLDVSHISANKGQSDPASAAIARIYAQLGVDAIGLKTLIAESMETLSKITQAA